MNDKQLINVIKEWLKNNLYNTWNNKTRYYIKDIKVNHLDYLIKLYKAYERLILCKILNHKIILTIT